MADNNNRKKKESTEEERMMAKAVKLWSILKEQVFAPPYCTAIEQLVTRVQYVWNNISKETLTGLVHKTSIVIGQNVCRTSLTTRGRIISSIVLFQITLMIKTN